MKKVITALLSIDHLLIFVLCLKSLISTGIVKNFSILWIVPAIVAFFLHSVILFKKNFSFIFEISIAIFDVLFFAAPFLIFGFLLPVDISVILMWIVPLICSVIWGVLIILKKKKTDK